MTYEQANLLHQQSPDHLELVEFHLVSDLDHSYFGLRVPKDSRVFFDTIADFQVEAKKADRRALRDILKTFKIFSEENSDLYYIPKEEKDD